MKPNAGGERQPPATQRGPGDASPGGVRGGAPAGFPKGRSPLAWVQGRSVLAGPGAAPRRGFQRGGAPWQGPGAEPRRGVREGDGVPSPERLLPPLTYFFCFLVYLYEHSLFVVVELDHTLPVSARGECVVKLGGNERPGDVHAGRPGNRCPIRANISLTRRKGDSTA